MTTKPQVVLWDSCVIIDCLQQDEARYPDIFPMVQQAQTGALTIVVSEISIAEVARLDKLAERGASLSEQKSVIEDWFDLPYVVAQVVDRSVSMIASRLKRNHAKLKTCDAVVLATALRHGVPIVYTYDGLTKPDGLLQLNGAVANPDGEFLQIMAPAGRPDGQTNLPVWNG
jgi:predicted nucleic acid-binding protein